MVVGGADTYMAAGFAGYFSEQLGRLLAPALRAHVAVWAGRAAAATGGKIGHVAGTIEHLYHGELTTRTYERRHEILRQADFDPTTDVAVDSRGLLAWSSPKPNMHRAEADYFGRRAISDNQPE
jgi:hypothetical protein